MDVAIVNGRGGHVVPAENGHINAADLLRLMAQVLHDQDVLNERVDRQERQIRGGVEIIHGQQVRIGALESDLEETRNDLEGTRSDLEQTRNNLAGTREQFDELQRNYQNLEHATAPAVEAYTKAQIEAREAEQRNNALKAAAPGALVGTACVAGAIGLAATGVGAPFVPLMVGGAIMAVGSKCDYDRARYGSTSSTYDPDYSGIDDAPLCLDD